MRHHVGVNHAPYDWQSLFPVLVWIHFHPVDGSVLRLACSYPNIGTSVQKWNLSTS